MTPARILIALAFIAILGVPFALRPAAEKARSGETPTLIIVTPHVQQLRREFSAAFRRWHEANYGGPAEIDWRTPGGTSEIIKQLESQYLVALKAGRFEVIANEGAKAPEVSMKPGTVAFDLMLGGGSYDHGRLKAGVPFVFPEHPELTRVPMSVPAPFPKEQLEAWYGENRVGTQPLYDPDGYWLGTALSSFGIVYNRDVVKRLGLPEPRTFEDLTDPHYAGWVALADPRQSGSIATAFDAVLNNYGWERGWRILREMTANTRYFTNSSTKPPIDISAGEAAAGLAIDFYGRSQGQSILRPGEKPEEGRVGYSDPIGAVYIDADPVSMLRGAPHPDLAARFVEFCLSEEAQALWQLPAVLAREAGSENPVGSGGARLGPEQYELRRMPVRRVMYEKYFEHFIDKVNPFEIASDTTTKGWRTAIPIMMGAFAIDIADEQRSAWAALNRARADASFPRDRLAEMEAAFYAWPTTPASDGSALEFSPETIGQLKARWKDPRLLAQDKIAYTAFFSDQYRRVRELAAAGR